jgi:hypothetical protein
MKKQQFSAYIQTADFRSLFNELGWDHKPLNRSIASAEGTFKLEAVAEKRDFFVMRCQTPTGTALPNQAVRRSISRQFEKIKNYHLIIFTNAGNTEQRWQFVLRLPHRPPKYVEASWSVGQDVELLYQKVRGLFFDLDEEENITIVEVIAAVQEAAGQNAEKITKKFYEGFKKEHRAFIDFIEGIQAKVDQEWYASLMLNRLMFCYFIQKKRFLDNNPNYLSDKLREVQETCGEGEFYSFYRSFLLVLFHEGLNASGDKPSIVGEVPYLNGGLFSEHELEQRYGTALRIPDTAFARIFQFFDQYEWHLDNRMGRQGNEINPDVIGYIFEKYINDRADMGAYYTKEDITDYIAKNCTVPFLFDETERRGADIKPAFELLQQDPDRYIYPAIRHGVTWDYRLGHVLDSPIPLPSEIAEGLDTTRPQLVERRKAWNREAPPEAGLPTEWWREVVERRQRYQSVKEKLERGEIKHINDLITHNLDIRRFAQDVLLQTQDAQFLRRFFEALSQMSVLDPTCGSGAFLFAALNILEPLYEAALERMSEFVATDPLGRHPTFERVLQEANDTARHPNMAYFIHKKIIVHNLYGVDLMREAVEIAKLRLFLKLMSTVEADRRKPNLGLEPLPDVDFNIRSGNALVGFATLEEAREAIRTRDGSKQLLMVFGDELNAANAVEEKAELVARAYQRFQDAQIVNDLGSSDHHKAKSELRTRLADLNESLNLYASFLYGIEKIDKPKQYQEWLHSHQPFHWFAEFYGVLYDEEGRFKGFDVVIGNPPYVEYSQVKKNYSLMNFSTIDCGNLFAFCIERSYKLSGNKSSTGMIVPISSISTPRMEKLQELIAKEKTSWISNYAVRPGKLFDGVDMNLTIILSRKGAKESKAFSTPYLRWYTEERPFLFFKIPLHNFEDLVLKSSIAKVGNSIEVGLLEKIRKEPTFEKIINRRSKIYYHSGGRYFRKCLLTQLSNEYKPLQIPENAEHNIIALLSSSFYYWFWIVFSDTYHVTKVNVESLNIKSSIISDLKLTEMGKLLIDDIWKNAKEILRNRKEGAPVKEINFFIGKSKPIIDKIDTLLASHYGFSEEELDFIINYDIKYRMGREAEE